MAKAALMVAASMLAACGSAPPAEPLSAPLPSSSASASTGEGGSVLGLLGGVTGKALEAVGLKQPDVPDAAKLPDSALPDWRIHWRLFASDSLNVDESGRSLALLVRIYRLKSPDSFLQAAYDTFGDPDKEKAALQQDLIGVRELQLLPGQRHEAMDKVPREAPYIGIVALYRQPAGKRWRYAFHSAAAEKQGLHLGLHACAMSVQVGEAIGSHPHSMRHTALACS